MSSPSIDMNISHVAESLQRANHAFTVGSFDAAAWSREVEPLVLTLVEAAGDNPNWLRPYFGLMLHSVAFVRHANPQALEVLSICGALDSVLNQLGPGPMLTHRQYWLDSNDTLFTRSQPELFFRRAVRTQVQLRATANETLRFVINEGVSSFGTLETARMLGSVAAALEAGHASYLDFKRGPNGEEQMTGEQFMVYRQFLGPVTVQGRLWSGPNAAAFGEMISTEGLLGLANDGFRAYAASFEDYQTADERALVAADLCGQTLLDIVAEALGDTSGGGLARAEDGKVAALLSVDQGLLLACKAVVAVHRAFIGGSGAHYGLIVSHLVKPGIRMLEEERAKMPVQPDNGVGGHGHELTKELHDRRRGNPAFAVLRRALRLSEEQAA